MTDARDDPDIGVIILTGGFLLHAPSGPFNHRNHCPLQSPYVGQCITHSRCRSAMPHDAVCFTRGLVFPLERLRLSQRLPSTWAFTRAVLQVLEQRLSAVVEIKESEERVAMWGQTKCPASMYWTCR